jgi:hypothetical protein
VRSHFRGVVSVGCLIQARGIDPRPGLQPAQTEFDSAENRATEVLGNGLVGPTKRLEKDIRAVPRYRLAARNSLVERLIPPTQVADWSQCCGTESVALTPGLLEILSGTMRQC